MTRWNEADFDLYLFGQMEEDVRADFESDLYSDSDLNKRLTQHKRTIELIQKSFSRKVMKSRLHRMHAEMFKGDGEVDIRQMKRARLIRFTANLAAAASVAAVITLAIIYLANGFRLDRQDVYVELRNEVNDISSQQESIKQELRKSHQKPVLFTGTSFAVSSDGLLATNYHVIRDLDSVWVSNYTDSLVRYVAAIVYRNPKQDIALLKITDPQFKGFGRLPYSRSVKGAEMGEYVYTLGYSKQDVVFGEGSISSVSGYYGDTTSYQISIPVNPGNSGGPLFDEHGNLLGMISGKNTQKDGVGFAIKSDYIFNAIQELAGEDAENTPVIQWKNRIYGKKRTEQLKTLQTLVFRVQIAR
ncbi:MAG: serine protease [Bacteroidales bacterium]